MIRPLLVALLLAAGCAEPDRRYPLRGLDLTVVLKPRNSITAASCGVTKDDDGENVQPGEQYYGCWRPAEREIWVDRLQPKVLLHELCHVAGYTRQTCEDDYGWDD